MLSKKITEIKSELEKYFSIRKVEWDTSAVAFHVADSPDVIDQFEVARKELKTMGYIAALRTSESNGLSLEDSLTHLATSPQLREVSQRITDSKELDVRRAWVDRFLELVRCPDCGSHLYWSGREISCTACDWGKMQGSDKGYVVVVTHLPKITPRSVQVNIALLILTIITTTITGSTLWMGYQGEAFSDSFLDTMITATFTPEFVLNGALFFSLPLMVILGTHELGHYFMSRHYGVNASLPFFIPIPPGISVLGTMGAFISMREPMPNKKALFDIGIAGPIAGLVMAIPVTIIGFLLTEPVEHIYTAGHGPNVGIGFPFLFQILYTLFTPDGGLHPTAFAGWVGLFVTALNLLPAGQLDGGHVARALMGEKSKYLSYTTLTIMILVGSFLYPAWLILGILIMFLGAYHPPPLNDLADLDVKRKAMGVFSIVLLVLCFTPQPIIPLEYSVDVFVEETDAEIQPGDSITFTFHIVNDGQINNTYDIYNESIPEYWDVTLSRNNVSLEAEEDNDEGSKIEIFVNITVPVNATPMTQEEVKIKVVSQNESASTFGTTTPSEIITFRLFIQNSYDLMISPATTNITISSNETVSQEFFVNNTGKLPVKTFLNHIVYGDNLNNISISLSFSEMELVSGNSSSLKVDITMGEVANDTNYSVVIVASTSTPYGEIVETAVLRIRTVDNNDDTTKRR